MMSYQKSFNAEKFSTALNSVNYNDVQNRKHYTKEKK